MVWIQRRLVLPPHSTGFFAITKEVEKSLPELSDVSIGLVNLFLQHTSASLTINENADENVLEDLGNHIDKLVPESNEYTHQLEGKDDMPGHIKSSLFGVSLTIPIENGRMTLGTWQDIYLCEHREEPHQRTLILTLNGTN